MSSITLTFEQAPLTFNLFSVFEAPQKSWKEIRGIAHEWTLFARTKMRELRSERELFEIYGDIQDLTDTLFDILQEPSSPPESSILLCKDSEEIPQAIAHFDKSSNRINILVTNPNNIQKRLNHRFHRIGAGSAIMLYSIKKTVEAKRESLKVFSWERSYRFYKEIFFFDSVGHETSLILELSLEKIKRLISSGVEPFTLLE